jgi:hypothetical protein
VTVDPAVWVVVAAGVAALCGALFAVGRLARWVWHTARKLGHLVDDLTGEPERDGHPARPSLMARVGKLEAEMRPNGGSSIKDQLNRMEGRLATVEARLGDA